MAHDAGEYSDLNQKVRVSVVFHGEYRNHYRLLLASCADCAKILYVLFDVRRFRHEGTSTHSQNSVYHDTYDHSMIELLIDSNDLILLQ